MVWITDALWMSSWNSPSSNWNLKYSIPTIICSEIDNLNCIIFQHKCIKRFQHELTYLVVNYWHAEPTVPQKRGSPWGSGRILLYLTRFLIRDILTLPGGRGSSFMLRNCSVVKRTLVALEWKKCAGRITYRIKEFKGTDMSATPSNPTLPPWEWCFTSRGWLTTVRSSSILIIYLLDLRCRVQDSNRSSTTSSATSQFRRVLTTPKAAKSLDTCRYRQLSELGINDQLIVSVTLHASWEEANLRPRPASPKIRTDGCTGVADGITICLLSIEWKPDLASVPSQDTTIGRIM